MVVISVYTYGVKTIKKFRWKSGFLKGVPWNPLFCTNGSAGCLMQLSFKIQVLHGLFTVIFDPCITHFKIILDAINVKKYQSYIKMYTL